MKFFVDMRLGINSRHSVMIKTTTNIMSTKLQKKQDCSAKIMRSNRMYNDRITKMRWREMTHRNDFIMDKNFIIDVFMTENQCRL